MPRGAPLPEDWSIKRKAAIAFPVIKGTCSDECWCLLPPCTQAGSGEGAVGGNMLLICTPCATVLASAVSIGDILKSDSLSAERNIAELVVVFNCLK